jgi:hypothetical protein
MLPLLAAPAACRRARPTRRTAPAGLGASGEVGVGQLHDSASGVPKVASHTAAPRTGRGDPEQRRHADQQRAATAKDAPACGRNNGLSVDVELGVEDAAARAQGGGRRALRRGEESSAFMPASRP